MSAHRQDQVDKENRFFLAAVGGTIALLAIVLLVLVLVMF